LPIEVLKLQANANDQDKQRKIKFDRVFPRGVSITDKQTPHTKSTKTSRINQEKSSGRSGQMNNREKTPEMAKNSIDSLQARAILSRKNSCSQTS
jgi:hypothetical protein